MSEKRYRKVSVQIWGDAKFNSLSPEGKLTFMFVLTHPNLTGFGAMRATVEGLRAELGVPEEGFWEPFTKGLLKASDEAPLIVLPKFLKHNPPENENVVKGWRKAIELLPECSLLDEHLKSILATLCATNKTLMQAFTKGLPEGFMEPLTEGYTKGLPEPSAEPLTEGYTKGLPEPSAEPLTEGYAESGTGTGTGTVSRSTPSDDGDARVRAREGPPQPKNGTSTKSESKKVTDRIDELVEVWNAWVEEHNVWARQHTIREVKPVVHLEPNGKVRQAARARVKSEWWWANFREALSRIRGSPFLSGQRPGSQKHRPFTMSFEFLVRPDTVSHILSGKYHDEQSAFVGSEEIPF